MRPVVLLCLSLLPAVAGAAINPAEFTRRAPLQLQLRPTTQIVDHFERDGADWRRTTIVATVVAEHVDAAAVAVGDTVVIDWSVNLDAQADAAAEHARRMEGRSGAQFMYAPSPPVADADGLIWAHLQDDPVATAVAPPAATAPATAHDADRRVGPIRVPAASKYSFDPPSD